MKIFVTGANGFLGSLLCKDLVAAGHQVHALVRSPEKAWRLEEIKDQIRYHCASFADIEALEAIFKAERFDAVAHLGWSGVANFDRNTLTQVKNIDWSVTLLDLAAQNGVETFLSLGSQAEYGPQSGVLTPESTTNPTTLYGKAKLSTYILCEHAAQLKNIRFVWMRVFSTFGQTDHPYWMVPSLIGKLLAAERLPLTKGEQKWDFLYGPDAAQSMRMALENNNAKGIYCLGSGNAPALKDTIEMIRDLVDPELPLGLGDIEYRPDQVMILQADISKLNKDIGWSAQTSLQDALQQTVGWYRDNRWIYDDAK